MEMLGLTPELQAVAGTLFVLFLTGATLQVQRLREKLRQTAA
jgi:hypothetical protein